MEAYENAREPFGIILTDEKIIELYFERNENAISETEKKYGKYLFAIAYNILRNESDSEECRNDTYLGAWNSIPPTKPNSFSAYLAKIIRGIAINRWRKNQCEKRIPPDAIDSLSDFEGYLSEKSDLNSELDAKEIGKLISDYLRTSTERKRYIFMSRYYYIRPIAVIADSLCVSQSAVKKQLSSMKKELRNIFESEGIEI